MTARSTLVLALLAALVLAGCSSGAPDGTDATPDDTAAAPGAEDDTGTADGDADGADDGAPDDGVEGADDDGGEDDGGEDDDGFGSSVTTGEADVRSELEVRVAETISRLDGRLVEDGTLLTVPAEVLFDFDEATLRADALDTLDAVFEVVQFYEQAPLRLVGHTDDRGSDAYNLDLSERRARSVAEFLTDAGVSPDRLDVSGRGEAEPVASNDDEDGRQQNRRVELLLVGVEPPEDAP